MKKQSNPPPPEGIKRPAPPPAPPKPYDPCSCVNCGKQAPEDYEPPRCCGGFECGCMGMPTEPYICGEECWKALMECEPKPEKCNHGNTRFAPEPWPTGEAIEICKNCGMSRSHWEQGVSDWLMVDIENARVELQKAIDDL